MAVAVLAPSVDVPFGRRISGSVQCCWQPSPVISHGAWKPAAVGRRRASTDSNSSSSSSESPNHTPRYVHQQQITCPSKSGGNAVGAGTDARFEAILMSAKAQGKTTLCIWFHFLAGKGADWEHGLKAKIANQLPWVEWYFPDAPKRPVTNYDGAIEQCWFDQLEGQATETMATPGLEVSVSMVHSLLRQAAAHGFPPNRILLGGMSQGGVLAMTAGFSYEKPLAGIIAASAWVPPCLTGMMRQPTTPLMFTNGDQDNVVPMNMFQKSARKLEQAGCSRIAKKVYPGLGHSWNDCECPDVKNFILAAAPPSTQISAGRPCMASPRCSR